MMSIDSPAALLVRDTRALLSLPEVCLRLREVLADPAHSRKQVAEVILHDPALSVRLLRIVNSAYYGLASPVRDISQALGIIGEQELKNLATVTAIVRNMRSLQPAIDLVQFWKRSIFAATLARNLGSGRDHATREEYFLGGLLLDIGKLLIYAREPALAREVATRTGQGDRLAEQVERDLLGFDHSDVGVALARSWRLSELLQTCIGSHHRYPERQDRFDLPALMYVVAFCADRIDLEHAAEDIAYLQALLPEPLLGLLDIDASEMTFQLAASIDGSRHAYDAFCGGT